MYASVDIKPKKPSVYHPKEDDRVEYAAIAYQPKDAAKKSQAAAAPAPKTKRYENAGMCVRCGYQVALFTNLPTTLSCATSDKLGWGRSKVASNPRLLFQILFRSFEAWNDFTCDMMAP